MNIIQFNAGNPIHSFDELASASWHESLGQFGRYPESIATLINTAFGNVPSFLKKHGLFPKQPAQKPSQNMCFGYGVTHAFHQIMSVLCQHAATLNHTRCERNLPPLQPVLLAPVPTYTFFFDGLSRQGIKIIPIIRNQCDNWSLSPDLISKTLETIRHDNQHLVVGYYDNNPNNPTGRIRDQAETSIHADIFDNHN